jgi:hypothetical protein
VNNHPKSDAATNDPKEQRSWSELSPQMTMTGPADPKEQRPGPADPKEQPLTNCR